MEIKIIRPGPSNLQEINDELQKDRWETLENSSVLSNLIKFIGNRHNYLILAYENGNVVGVIEAYNLQKFDWRNNEMLLYSIEVKKKYRKKGIAKAMLLKLREIAIKEGSHEIWVLTDKNNVAAKNLYKSLGIKTVESEQIMFNYPLK